MKTCSKKRLKRLSELKVLSPDWLELIYDPSDLFNKDDIYNSIYKIGFEVLNNELNTNYSYIKFKYENSRDILFKETIWNFINENYEYDKFFFIKTFGEFEKTLIDYIPEKIWDKHIK